MAKNNGLMTDGLTNVVSGLGTSKSKRSHYDWQYDLLNAWQQLDACYQSNWIAQSIVDIPAEDMTRQWRRIKSEYAEDIAAAEQHFDLSDHTLEVLKWARLYGGAGVLMVTNQDMTKPLNVNKIKKGSLERLLVFDRWEMSPQMYNSWDVLAANYLQPEFYTIQGGSQRIHWSHFALFRGTQLPRRQRVQLQGWGDSILRRCLEEVNDIAAAKGGIAELMTEANVDIIKRTGLGDELTTDQDEAIIDRYTLFSQLKSIVHLALLDEQEEYDRKTLQLSGVAPILEQMLSWVSGCARIPVTKLFGTSAKGLNATGEGDLKTYYDDVSAMQQQLARPLRVLDQVMVRSALGFMPDDFDYVWNPLAQPNQLEVAQAGLLKAQKNTMYLDAGVVMRSQIQRELQADEEYQFDDSAIEELEEMESANMFDDLVPDEPPAPEDTGDEFLDRYRAMSDAGMTHDAIMIKLSEPTP